MVISDLPPGLVALEVPPRMPSGFRPASQTWDNLAEPIIAPPLVVCGCTTKPCTTAGKEASAKTTAARILDAAEALAEPTWMALPSLIELGWVNGSKLYLIQSSAAATPPRFFKKKLFPGLFHRHKDAGCTLSLSLDPSRCRVGAQTSKFRKTTEVFPSLSRKEMSGTFFWPRWKPLAGRDLGAVPLVSLAIFGR
jgi:hypothetical protein